MLPSDLAESARAAEGPAEADRRLVSVLFADLSGFTVLSERLDPEDVRAFQSDLFRELASAIEHYEGFVEKFVGDAVMAVFGARMLRGRTQVVSLIGEAGIGKSRLLSEFFVNLSSSSDGATASVPRKAWPAWASSQPMTSC